MDGLCCSVALGYSKLSINALSIYNQAPLPWDGRMSVASCCLVTRCSGVLRLYGVAQFAVLVPSV